MQQLLKISQAATRLNISRSYAHELAARRAIPVVLVGGCIRVPSEALERWISEHVELNEDAR